MTPDLRAYFAAFSISYWHWDSKPGVSWYLWQHPRFLLALLALSYRIIHFMLPQYLPFIFSFHILNKTFNWFRCEFKTSHTALLIAPKPELEEFNLQQSDQVGKYTTGTRTLGSHCFTTTLGATVPLEQSLIYFHRIYSIMREKNALF